MVKIFLAKKIHVVGATWQITDDIVLKSGDLQGSSLTSLFNTMHVSDTPISLNLYYYLSFADNISQRFTATSTAEIFTKLQPLVSFSLNLCMKKRV